MLGDRGQNLKLATATVDLDSYMSNTWVDAFIANIMIDLIVRRGANPNHKCESHGQTPLMILSVMGRHQRGGHCHGEIMKGFRFLLDIPGIDVNPVDKHGNALIHKVVVMEDPLFLDMLLQIETANEHINMLDAVGLAPLHLACALSTVTIPSIRHLLERGANPYLPSRVAGYAPLYYAIGTYGVDYDMDRLRKIFNVFVGKYEVQIGRFRGKKGENIMHVVAKYVNDAKFCAKVLRHGGGEVLDEKNDSGRTPLEEAHVFGHDKVVGAIQKSFVEWVPMEG